jgi:hypothetical protein
MVPQTYCKVSESTEVEVQLEDSGFRLLERQPGAML